MSELIINHCSPTLAGLKTGSLFSYRFDDAEKLRSKLRELNRIFVPKGMRVVPLFEKDGKALIYVYRPKKLKADLSDGISKKILCECGYDCKSPEEYIVAISKRLGEGCDFPHEIGLFLGYEPSDVDGFMHRKEDFLFVGTWKVYGNEKEAKNVLKSFASVPGFTQNVTKTTFLSKNLPYQSKNPAASIRERQPDFLGDLLWLFNGLIFLEVLWLF